MHSVTVLRRNALIRQNGRCAYCKEPLPESLATADHKHPRCRGGRNSERNVVAACWPCNKAKGTMHEDRFYALIGGPYPPYRVSSEILLIWASRRIWKRAQRACQQIERRAA